MSRLARACRRESRPSCSGLIPNANILVRTICQECRSLVQALNCGFRLPTAAGTDFMGNYASLRGPAGRNRAYAEVPASPLKLQSSLESIKAGRTFANEWAVTPV